jgi:hypothetical protein
MKSKLFLDMDGVLADFFGVITKLAGKKHYKDLSIDDIFKVMNQQDVFNLFKDLPEFKSNNVLMQKVMKFTNGEGYYICSSPLMDDRDEKNSRRNRYFIQQSIIGKKAWIDQHLSPTPIKICFSKEKWKDAPAVENGIPNILIDDHQHNVDQWNNAGGIAIKFQADEHQLDANLTFLDKELEKAAKIIKKIEKDKNPDKFNYDKKVKSYLENYKGS